MACRQGVGRVMHNDGRGIPILPARIKNQADSRRWINSVVAFCDVPESRITQKAGEAGGTLFCCFRPCWVMMNIKTPRGYEIVPQAELPTLGELFRAVRRKLPVNGSELGQKLRR